jgi:uncharacterized protein (DUF2126 family)
MRNDGVDELADAVESRLQELGLSLTMGGEPTFIPAAPETPEWNQEAIGPAKLGYARRLAARLLRELYPGGLVMQVYGKQYPGEPLPRWVVLILHRDDGVPLWGYPEMLLLDDVPGPNTNADALRLMTTVAAELELAPYVLPCVEEGHAPDSPRGWVLPLDWTQDGWVSDSWPFSAKQPLVAVPGKSPLGLRLPLGDLDESHLRRAFTVEATDGGLHLFIPPLDFEAFIALVALLERVAMAEGVAGLVIGGYQPTVDAPLTALGLAADPGVLEVNVPPARCWQDYDRLLGQVTRAAEKEGLVTTRYHLNGQVQGTGGGAHLLFGGPSLDDNPFFQRPELVGSIIRYWQQHPALSYFFSGQYVGPGSQAPRADETLVGKLYELETACLGAVSSGDVPDRGFLDGLFRNLMTDSGGNTHRAELCFDKLWNLDSPAGLQGLIELRAFETLPDVDLQSLAALFIRSILAMLAGEPRDGPLVRHGARLHDACMLPSVLWHHIEQICADLEAVGLAFDSRWLEPIFELRFPVLGRLVAAEGEVLARQALEPWPLMAEIADGGITSRIVDNSTDRIELSMTDPAVLGSGHVVVNGVAVRFRELGRMLVAGVRYKSAGGWPALHPHIPVQSPLEIEVVDGRDEVVTSARYYFWNPDEPIYDGWPRNLAEAQGRQKARWRPSNDRRGLKRKAREPVYTEESQYTLDLRRQTLGD